MRSDRASIEICPRESGSAPRVSHLVAENGQRPLSVCRVFSRFWLIMHRLVSILRHRPSLLPSPPSPFPSLWPSFYFLHSDLLAYSCSFGSSCLRILILYSQHVTCLNPSALSLCALSQRILPSRSARPNNDMHTGQSRISPGTHSI